MRSKCFLFTVLFVFGLSVPTLSFSVQQASSLRLEDSPTPVIIYPGVITKLSATFPRQSSRITDIEFIDAKEVQVEFNQNGATVSSGARVVLPEFALGPDQQPLPRQSIYVKVPDSLYGGAVSLRLKWRGNISNSMSSQIPETLPAPVVGIIQKTMISTGNNAPPPPPSPEDTRKLEIGSTNSILTFPLVENNAAGDGILVSFRQGNLVLQAGTTVTLREWKPQSNEFGSYEVVIAVPSELLPGKAEMNVSLKVGGKLSAISTLPVTLVNRDSFVSPNNKIAPVIVDIVPKRIGKGQAFQVLVENGLSLQPKPAEVVIVLEKDGYQVRLSPEINFALATPSPGFQKPDASAPVLLLVRTNAELSGQVKVRILNPVMGETFGLSAPVTLEIANEVLPPFNLKVGTSSETELQPLKIMQAAANPREKYFDPNANYMTVQADGLDGNPQYVWLAIEQNGKQIELSRERDIAVTINNSIVFKVPSQIGAGKARILLANKGFNTQSVTVSAEFEIPKRSK